MKENRMKQEVKMWSLCLLFFLIGIAGAGWAAGGPSPLHNHKHTIDIDKSDSKSDALNQMLKEGRKPAYLKLSNQNKTGLLDDHKSLLASEIYQLNLDAVSGDPGYVAFDTDKMPLIREEQLDKWSLSFLQGWSDKLGVPVNQWFEAPRHRIRPNHNILVLTWNRMINDVLVYDARIKMVFAKSGDSWKLREIVNHSYGDFSLEGADSEKMAWGDLSISHKNLTQYDEKEVIYIVGGDNGYAGYVSQQWLVKSDQGETFTLMTKKNDGSVIGAWSHRLSAGVKITGEVFNRSVYYNQSVQRPLAYAAVNGQLNADAAGIFETDLLSFELGLTGNYSSVYEFNALQGNQNNNPYYRFPVNVVDNKVEVLQSQVNPAALNVYVAINEVQEFARRFLDPDQVPFLANPINVIVDRPDTCNAYYDGNLNFFVSGNGCSNTSLISDIVYHEWGHALDDNMGTQGGQGGITDGAFSEGIGDIISAYMTGSSNMAPGFFIGQEAGIRNLDNNATYPPANQQEQQVHVQGQIIGGTFWDLRSSMIKKYGPKEGADVASKLFFTHLLTTDSYIESMDAVLRLNDDDGNPATVSPDNCLIQRAFAGHNLTNDPGDDCIDLDPGIKLRIEWQNENDELELLASSGGAEAAVICRGDVTECNEGQDGFVAFERITEADFDQKAIFKGLATVKVSSDESFTVFSFGADGVVLGRLVTKFASP